MDKVPFDLVLFLCCVTAVGGMWIGVSAQDETEPAPVQVVESVDFNTQFNVTRCYYIAATGQTLFCERVGP